MQPLISVTSAQRAVALLLFVVATGPVWVLGIGALCMYRPAAAFQPLIAIAAYPGGGAQWFAYLALLVSTWAGATLTAVFVTPKNGLPYITRIGIGFLAYVGATVALGIVFVVYAGIPENVGPLREALPPSLFEIDPGLSEEDGRAAAKEAGNAVVAEMSNYVHWALGGLLAMGASILAMPGPKTQETQQQQS